VTVAPLRLHSIITRDGAQTRALDEILGHSLMLATIASVALTAVMAALGRAWVRPRDLVSPDRGESCSLSMTIGTLFDGAFIAASAWTT
jgi:hypothetical protein